METIFDMTEEKFRSEIKTYQRKKLEQLTILLFNELKSIRNSYDED